MARRIFIFDPPDRFVCGTVGPMGERTFFLQALQGERIVSVVLEKIQVAAIAERIGAIVADLDLRSVEAAAGAPVSDDDRPLDEPVREEFRVGTIALAWDADEAMLMIEAREQTGEEDEGPDIDDDDPDGPDLLGLAARVHRRGVPTSEVCPEVESP